MRSWSEKQGKNKLISHQSVATKVVDCLLTIYLYVPGTQLLSQLSDSKIKVWIKNETLAKGLVINQSDLTNAPCNNRLQHEAYL